MGPEGAGTMRDDVRAWEDRDAIQQVAELIDRDEVRIEEATALDAPER